MTEYGTRQILLLQKRLRNLVYDLHRLSYSLSDEDYRELGAVVGLVEQVVRQGYEETSLVAHGLVWPSRKEKKS